MVLTSCKDKGIAACRVELMSYAERQRARALYINRAIYAPQRLHCSDEPYARWNGTLIWGWTGKINFFGKCLNVVGYATSKFNWPTEWDTDCEQEGV